MNGNHGTHPGIRSLTIAIALAATIGCGDTYVTIPTAPTTITPPAPGAVVKTTVEFRALGTPTSVRVRYSTPVDGLAQVITTLPYSNGFTTSTDTLFVSLEGTPVAASILTPFPFFAIQIVINGAVFREATSNDLLLQTLQVSGTWRR